MRVYEQVYEYYVKQMEEGTLASGSRMPSLRETEKMLHVSRTSVETAYLQLMADGYIYSVEKVGYFVSDMMPQAASVKAEPEDGTVQTPVRYNLAAIGEDRRCSCLELWRRYMKSALRQEERLLSYAANRGEEELRREIASYVRKQRNIICSPEDIVIGAGFQSLLMILMAMVDGEKSVSFPTND
ncbi:MAG: GntR family transcriptional regulator, partial [Lachnospiraceae bacterium]|nr:GntR family transcriptional regulator [Lachnospiraceae bacterium]